MGKITGSGRTDKNSTFKLAMPVHSLSFTSKVSYTSFCGRILWTHVVYVMDYVIDQFRYIKIQPKTKDLSTRLWGITTECAEVCCVRQLNFNISKLIYFTCRRRLTSFPGKRKLVEMRLAGSVAVVNTWFVVFVKSVRNPPRP